MPAFKEYIATGKITPSDAGFTAFETAARRQQSFTADQVASVEKGAKLVATAWEGSLKFGLDEMELAQAAAAKGGGGGVNVKAEKGVERTLIGTGSNSGVTRNEVSRGAADLTRLARGLNNTVAKPVTAADGAAQGDVVDVLRGGSGQRITSVDLNPQAIPLNPGDINLQELSRFGVNPMKQITVKPLGAPDAPIDAGFETGQGRGFDVGHPQSGGSIWNGIKAMMGLPPDVGDAGIGATAPFTIGPDGKPIDKSSTLTIPDDMLRTGFDKSGIPFYGTRDTPGPKAPGGIIPTPQDNADTTGAPPTEQSVPVDTGDITDASSY